MMYIRGPTMQFLNIDKIFIIILGLVLSLGACAEVSDESNGPQLNTDQGRDLLRDHDIVAANQYYKNALKTSGTFSAGYAITSLLLLPYDASVTALIKHLGGKGALNAKADVLYDRKTGVFSLLAQGTPWEDQGGYSGIKTILGSDFPWTFEEIEGEGYIDKLTIELNTLLSDVQHIVGTFEPILDALEIAIEDPNFTVFELPGDVFSDDNLTLSLTKADLSFLTAILRFVRGGVYFASAYESPFLLSDLGSKWGEITENSPEYEQGYTAEDYRIKFLDDKLFRKISDKKLLTRARKEFKIALASLTRALSISLDRPRAGAFQWNEGNIDSIGKVVRFIDAIKQSLDQPTMLPFTAPSLEIDLSYLFEFGKVLPPEIKWFDIRVNEENSPFRLNLEAENHLLETIFSSPLERIKKSKLTTSAEFSDLLEAFLSTLVTEINDTYGN